MTLVIIVYYAVAIIIGAAYTGDFTVLAIYSMLLAIMYGAAATGVAFLISSVMKTATASLVLTFFMLFLILSIVATVFTVASIKPDRELTFAGGTISDIMVTPYPHDVPVTNIGGNATLAIPQYHSQVAPAIATEIVWLIVTGSLGYVAFKRREMVS